MLRDHQQPPKQTPLELSAHGIICVNERRHSKCYGFTYETIRVLFQQTCTRTRIGYWVSIISSSSRNRRMTWWRHKMETFSALLVICAGNSPVPGEFPAQRPVTRSFDVFFDLRLNKRLSKQSQGWWFETLSCSLWRHRNELMAYWLYYNLSQ